MNSGGAVGIRGEQGGEGNPARSLYYKTRTLYYSTQALYNSTQTPYYSARTLYCSTQALYYSTRTPYCSTQAAGQQGSLADDEPALWILSSDAPVSVKPKLRSFWRTLELGSPCWARGQTPHAQQWRGSPLSDGYTPYR
jgi:hypothetical protein